MKQLTAEDVADALKRTIEREHESNQAYVDNLGDCESIIIDGTLNLVVLAEELNRAQTD